MWKRAPLSPFTILCLHTEHKRGAHTSGNLISYSGPAVDLAPFYFSLYSICFLGFFLCAFQSAKKTPFLSSIFLSVADKHFLITIETRISVRSGGR